MGNFSETLAPTASISFRYGLELDGPWQEWATKDSGRALHSFENCDEQPAVAAAIEGGAATDRQIASESPRRKIVGKFDARNTRRLAYYRGSPPP
jgi:hypothetical protein